MKFKYVAQDVKGNRITETTTADTLGSLVNRLKKDGLLPIQVSEVKPSADIKKYIFPLRNRVKSKELVVFTRQLAATLTAGLLLTEALETIMDDMENEYFQSVIKNIISDIRGGHNFSAALVKYPKIFPFTYTSLIKSGEATGSLDKTLTGMAEYLEATERLKEKVLSAIAYPSFVFGFAFFVVFIMVVFLIPKFASLFSGAKVQLPLLTRIIVGISNVVLHNLFVGFLLFIASIIAFWYAMKFPQFKYQVDVLKFKIPILGKEIIRKATVSRFCRTLSVLLEGGVGMVIALEIVRDVVDHRPMAEAIEKIKTRVLGGSNLADELRNQKVFPRMVSKMVAVGQRTGRIDQMLARTSDYYEDELENTLKKLTSILEPALIVFVGGVVLIVVLALYLPIFKMSSAIR
jgi:type IV pilus assembly protein PilC